MSKKPNNTMIGLFIIIGVGLFAGMIAVFVSSKILKYRTSSAVMYFSESVKGLDVGSPVVFKGVEIGQVSKIDIIMDKDGANFSIPVYVNFEGIDLLSERQGREQKEVLDDLVQKGLRGRLNMQNILTGQLMIELEIMPENEGRNYQHSRRQDEKIPEIPTVLSTLAQLSRGLQDMPIKETLDNINSFFAHMSKDTSPVLQSMDDALKDVSAAAKSLRNLTDYLEQYPESIIKGKR